MTAFRKGDLIYKYTLHSEGILVKGVYRIEAVNQLCTGKYQVEAAPTQGRSSKVYLPVDDIDSKIFHSSKIKSVYLSEDDPVRACDMVLRYLENKMRELLSKLDSCSNMYDAVKKERGKIG